MEETSEQTSLESTSKGALLFAVVIVAILLIFSYIPLIYYQSMIFLKLWDWFIFGEYISWKPSIFFAIGVVLIKSLLLVGTSSQDWTKFSGKNNKTNLVYSIILPYIASTLVLAAGWFVNRFF